MSVNVKAVGPTKNTGIRFHDEKARSSIIPLLFVASFLGTKMEIDSGVLGSAQSSVTWESLLRKPIKINLENCYI